MARTPGAGTSIQSLLEAHPDRLGALFSPAP